MTELPPVPLTPKRIDLDSPEFEEIRGWPFTGDDPYVGESLQSDIAQRVSRGPCRLCVYCEPAGENVGFGTRDECDYYSGYAGGRIHLYIPLLAVNPAVVSTGYGTSIVKHLIGAAALARLERNDLADVLFLDVYEENQKGIEVYERCGFTRLEDQPTPDPAAHNRRYYIMATRICLART